MNGEKYIVGTEITLDGEYELVATDRMGNVTTVNFVIDTQSPIANVAYNITSPTKKSVTVRVKVDEEVEFSKGEWIKESDYQYKLVYRENTTEDIVLTDKAGNTTTITIKINNIDKTAPTAKVTYSNGDLGEATMNPVTVTLVASEPVKDLEGWNRVNETTFTKEYTKNGNYNVAIEDLVGNVTNVKFEVKGIIETKIDIEYSTYEPAKSVMVTVTSNRAITILNDGTWETTQEGKRNRKVFYINVDRVVDYVDELGNKGTINIKINNIDNQGPTAEISQKVDESDPNKVWVTFKFDEPIDENSKPQGLDKVEGNTYIKAYFLEREYSITVKDLLGNESTINFKVTK